MPHRLSAVTGTRSGGCQSVVAAHGLGQGSVGLGQRLSAAARTPNSAMPRQRRWPDLALQRCTIRQDNASQ